MDVGLLLVDQETLTAPYQNGIEYGRGSARFRVPSLPNLIALKLHASKNNRDRGLRDASDIFALMKANPNVMAKRELIALCERYGSRRKLTLLEEHL